MSKSRTPTRAAPARDAGVFMSTSEGRARFPDILQSSYGNKAVVGFGRYGRALGALVPMEAVRLLAGFEECVDEDVRLRIMRTARSLIETVPAEAEMCGIEALEEPILDEFVEEPNRRSERTKQRVTR